MAERKRSVAYLQQLLDAEREKNGNLHSQLAILASDNDRKTKRLAQLRSLVRAVHRAAEEK